MPYDSYFYYKIILVFMQLSLLVIRSAIPEKLKEFYERLGLVFEHHRHGTGPYHFSAQIGPTVLEIYPLRKGQEVADKYLRFGLSIDSFDATVEELQKNGVHFQQFPMITE